MKKNCTDEIKIEIISHLSDEIIDNFLKLYLNDSMQKMISERNHIFQEKRINES